MELQVGQDYLINPSKSGIDHKTYSFLSRNKIILTYLRPYQTDDVFHVFKLTWTEEQKAFFYFPIPDYESAHYRKQLMNDEILIGISFIDSRMCIADTEDDLILNNLLGG